MVHHATSPEPETRVTGCATVSNKASGGTGGHPWCPLISREVRDAFAVVEPHVPRPVGCEDLPGLGDELWLRREHGDERSPRFSLLEVLLAHQSFVGQSAAD
jgi:hypothetical protein